MNRGIAACRIDSPYSDIGSAIEDYISSKGYEIAKLFCGHGIGRRFHDSPLVFHHRTDRPRSAPPQFLSAIPRKRVQERRYSYRNRTGIEDSSCLIKAGHAFTIEPIVCAGSADAVELSDGWTHVTRDGSISAQFEHTILMTDVGPEILTNRPLLGAM